MSAKWEFSETPIGEPLCVYDGTQESIDNCVATMCANLGIELKEDGQYPGEMIMVALWARILQLQERAESGIVACDSDWSKGERI